MKQKVDVNLVNDEGRSALHLASDAKKDYIVQLLLQNGANSSLADIHKITPLHLLLKWPRPKVPYYYII